MKLQMKYVNLFLALSCILLSSCSILPSVDEEGEKMMEIVKRIVDNPDRMKEIIETSNYYDSTNTEPIESRTLQTFINNIKVYKKEGIQYYYRANQTIGQLNDSDVKGTLINIGSVSNYSLHISFFFQCIDNKWVLVNVLHMTGTN